MRSDMIMYRNELNMNCLELSAISHEEYVQPTSGLNYCNKLLLLLIESSSSKHFKAMTQRSSMWQVTEFS